MARKIGSRYTALKVLGRGSCGTVWLGEGPEGPVAIKLLREDLASDQILVARFVQERTALVSLDHPNIVGIHDLVVDGSDLALVMDLVHGSDLRTRLERDRVLTPQLAAAITADVAEALAAAHREGVIHRDVKPENVLLDASSGALRARLTDFGIARLVDAPRRTRATRIIGTPDYLAPEIIEGLQPTAAVDVYALATVLYELLTGWTPFGGGHPGAVLRRHVTEPVPGIPGLPKPLADVLAACLSKAPAARLTAREFAERLRAAIPRLVGLPAFEMPLPEGHEDGVPPLPAESRRETPRPTPARDLGVVPLVSGAEPVFESEGGSRDTHTNLARPVFDEVPDQARRAQREGRRGRAVAAAVVAVVLIAGGAWWATRGTSGSKGAAHAPSATTSAPPNAAPPAGPTGTPAPGVPAWQHWTLLPAAPVAFQGGPSAAQAPGDRTVVVARDVTGQLWYTTGDGATYADWQRMPGLRAAEDPAVAASAPGRADALVVGQDRYLYRSTLSGGQWSGWTRLDAKTRISGPVAAVGGGDRLDVVARSDDALVAGSLSGGVWSGFTAVPSAGRIEQGPALTSSAPGTLDAFVVRSGDHMVMRVSFAGGVWSEPERLGPAASARPAAAWTQASGLVVVVRDGSGEATGAVVGSGTGDGSWRTADLGVASADAPALVAATATRLDVYVRNPQGRIAVSSAG